MGRAPVVLAATAAGTAALLAFHPHPAATAGAGGQTTTRTATGGGRVVAGTTQPTRYGPVQVRITVRAGRLTDVTALQLPQNEPRSWQISTYAAPLLRQEALTASSASIDAISGATFTSEGYRASLQAALRSAGI